MAFLVDCISPFLALHRMKSKVYSIDMHFIKPYLIYLNVCIYTCDLVGLELDLPLPDHQRENNSTELWCMYANSSIHYIKIANKCTKIPNNYDIKLF